MIYCTKCLSPETRPRVTFNKKGVCNACQWAERKNKQNWSARQNTLEALCKKFIRDTWDVIVPFSGGKDSVYVAWKMRELGMHPLLITLVPHLETESGKYNREITRKEFDCLTITPEYEAYRELAILGLTEQGRPKLPFVTGISTVVCQLALKLDIPFIMYGEEGEQEYGGASGVKTKIDRNYLVDYYYSGHDPSEYGSWWALPEQKQLVELYPTHFSKFEKWDSKVHADFAISKGMITEPQIGTFTDYSQLSDELQDLHTYLMYLKYGFGRATADVNIEIRAGRMSREEGIRIVREKDGTEPWMVNSQLLEKYSDYFKLSDRDFIQVVDGWANTEILEWKEKWTLKSPL